MNWQKNYVLLAPIDPEQGNFGLGNIAAANKDYSRALEYFLKVVEVSPDFSPVYHMRGQMYWMLGDDAKAAQDFRCAQEMGIELTSEMQALVNKY